MKRRLLILLTALAVSTTMLATFAAPVFAGTQGTPCPVSDPEKALVWENDIFDTGDGNDRLWRCSNDSTLVNSPTHTLAGTCKTQAFKTEDDWDDCISSLTLWLPSGRAFCLYSEANYSGLASRWNGPLAGVRIGQLPLALQDRATSLAFINTNQNCN